MRLETDCIYLDETGTNMQRINFIFLAYYFYTDIYICNIFLRFFSTQMYFPF